MRSTISRISNKRVVLILCIAAASIGYMFSIASTSIGVILLLFGWLVNLKELNWKNYFKKNNLNLFTFFFILLLISSSYSLDFQQAEKVIVRHLSFLVIPLVFLTIRPLSLKEKYFVIKVFVVSSSVFFLICFLNAVYRQIVFFSDGGVFNWYFFFRYDLLDIFGQHPTYVAMFTLMSIGFLLFYSEGKIFTRKLSILVILVQIIGLIFSGSRIGIIVLFIFFMLFLCKRFFFSLKRPNRKSILIFLMSLVLIISFFGNIPIIKERVLFTFGIDYDYKFNKKKHIVNGAPEKEGRLLLWVDALELINEKPIIGYGTGSNTIVLNKKYEEKGHLHFLNENYNTHNTYLELLISGGIFHLGGFLLILSKIFFMGWRKKDFILLSFLCIISIISITETIFRSQGIVFFTFFYCFLLSQKNEK